MKRKRVKQKEQDVDTPEISALRKEALQFLVDLKRWNIYPYRKDMIALRNEIKFSYNRKRLTDIRDALEYKLNKALMDKITQGADLFDGEEN